MTKNERAKKILNYLIDFDDTSNDITFDEDYVGGLCFKVKGLNEDIILSSKTNITDGYIFIAREIVREGLEIGRCQEVLKHEDEFQSKMADERKKDSDSLSNAFDMLEAWRLEQMTTKQKLAEIKSKYGIDVLDFAMVEPEHKYEDFVK